MALIQDAILQAGMYGTSKALAISSVVFIKDVDVYESLLESYCHFRITVGDGQIGTKRHFIKWEAEGNNRKVNISRC